MRPTGSLHLGHLHGVLKNWLKLQREYECFFFVADWHALTTEYEQTGKISQHVWDMVVDWLAVGIDPGSARLFIQSWVPEHAELHLLLSMVTPVSWLERVPSYKDQQEKLSGKDLTTYGFLGYPLLQSADIIMYKAGHVPVGEDQVAHVELAREIARRFNHIYGQEPDFKVKIGNALKKMGKKNAQLYEAGRKSWRQDGDAAALEQAREMLVMQKNITLRDRERLLGYLEGEGRMIFPEPQALLTEVCKMTGLDGQKMSKSYRNTIPLRGETASEIKRKLETMPTDPARVRVKDPGDPEKCSVWGMHQVYSNDMLRKEIHAGCTKATMGCVDCKRHVIDAVLQEHEEINERAREYLEDPEAVYAIVQEGSKMAREIAKETIEEVREVIGLSYKEPFSGEPADTQDTP